MTSKNKVLFDLNVNAPNKVKIMTLHPKKEWLAIINTANTFSLWNYRQKILIKNFNCNTLDDSKNFDIREIVFYDRYSLPYNTNAPMRTSIIFVSPFRIYLYDYLTDAIKQINQKQMQQKNIRKVCAYSQSQICVSLNDGSFKILDSSDLYSKNMMMIKNIRGYHTKPITWMIAYCQNQNEKPRVITVSGQDGLMACWNVDTLLHTNQIPDPASPSFKFIMKNGKSGSSNGEQILSLQYDNCSYRLITLTDSYITIWSTMTGMELNRLKNPKFKQIVAFNHFSFGANCFLAHNNKSILCLLRVNGNEIEIEDCYDLRLAGKQHDSNIVSIKTIPQNPSQVILSSHSSIVALQINKFYRPSYGFHHNFVTHLTTVNSKQFINRSEGAIKANIDRKSQQNMIFQEDILFNSFYLSFQNGWIHFNLIEILFENMLYEQRKYKMHKIVEESPFSRPTSTQSLIQIRFDAKQFFIFNPDLAYYQIYAIKDQSDQQSLLNIDQQTADSLDFSSKLVKVEGGHARDIVWHQYKQQFGIIKGQDKNGKAVEYVTEKKGFMGRGQKTVKLNAQVLNWYACIYQKNKKSNKYELIYKSSPLKTKFYRIYNFGFLFGYSSDQSGTQIIHFLNDQKLSNKQIQGTPSWPERVFISYCESFQIYLYYGYFVIYRVEENGQLSYFRSVQQTICEGIFWQKFFFFSTKSSIFFMQITNEDILLIKIADSMGTNSQKGFSLLTDDLQEVQQMMPQGQLQFLSVVNFHLLMLNHTGQIILLNLKHFSYIQFCIEIVLGNIERLGTIYRNSNRNLQKSMKQTLSVYGLNLPEFN